MARPLCKGADNRPPEVVVADGEVLQVDVVARHADRGKELVEEGLAPGVDVDTVPLGQVGLVVLEEEEDSVAKLLSRRGGERVMASRERSVLSLEDLLEQTAVLVLLDDEHPLPGIVLPEEEVESEPDGR